MNKKHRGSSLDEVLNEQNQSEAFQEAFERQQVISEIAQGIHALRLNKGWTQTKLAERAHTKQQVVARLEGGRDTRVPSLDLLNRLALAMGKRAVVHFE